MPVSFTGVIHYPRLKGRLATHFVPFTEFEKDAAAGTLPDFSLIEPNMLTGHGDYHPAFGRSFSAAVDLAVDNPSSMLSGEAFLTRVYAAYRSATSPDGANVWNTALLIGWDEPGGTYAHAAGGRPLCLAHRTGPDGQAGWSSAEGALQRLGRPAVWLDKHRARVGVRATLTSLAYRPAR